MEGQRDRFKDAPWVSENPENVVLGGIGGIGSWTAFLLERAGFKVIAYDDDIIETHNLGGQLFRVKDIGEFKTCAINQIIGEFSDSSITCFDNRIQNADLIKNYLMISAFDNMEARKCMFDQWKEVESVITPLFIDGRLSLDGLEIYCVTPKTINDYEETLFDDDLIEDEPCTMKQTSHMAAMIASHMVTFLTNHMTNVKGRKIIREVPFKYEYYAPLNLTKS